MTQRSDWALVAIRDRIPVGIGHAHDRHVCELVVGRPVVIVIPQKCVVGDLETREDGGGVIFLVQMRFACPEKTSRNYSQLV